MRDRLCIESLCTSGNFIMSTEESSNPFASFSFDGVLGLGIENLAQSKYFSLMSVFGDAHLLRDPIFSVFLSDSSDENSEITFGDIKREHMGSDLFWVNVSGTIGYWEVQIEDITLDAEPQNLCKDCRVAVDTGTSELAGPSSVISELGKLLNLHADCTGYDKMPKLGFVIGGHILSLDPSNYINNFGHSSCSVSLMSLDVPPPNGPLFIFGIPFLQKYFTVYDILNRRVGFATAKHIGREPEALLSIDLGKQPSRSSPLLSRKVPT
jgi:hypothetical protein